MESVEFLKLKEIFEAGISKIELLLKKKEKSARLYRSDDIKDLVTALAKAQAEYTYAPTTKTNPYFQDAYADLKTVVDCSRPALTKYELAVTQIILNDDDGAMYLITSLLHSSGQFMESNIRIAPHKNDVQVLSSHTERLKRLTYASLVGVVIEDLDDDGEIAVFDTRLGVDKGTALNTNYNPKKNSIDLITREQLEELEYELAEFPDIAEDILDGLKLQTLADMPKSKYMFSIDRIHKIKLLRKGK